MIRLFSVAMMVLLMGAAASAPEVRKFNIEVSATGINVENADFSASALRVSFDATKELLLLEGSAASPVTLTQHRDNKTHKISAVKIRLSLKDGRMVAEVVQRYQSVEPH